MVKLTFPSTVRRSYLYDCLFLDSLALVKNCLDLYLGYVARQGVFLYIK